MNLTTERDGRRVTLLPDLRIYRCERYEPIFKRWELLSFTNYENACEFMEKGIFAAFLQR